MVVVRRWAASRQSVAEGLRGTDNAFGILRLVLASAVIFSHAFYLGGWRTDPTHELTRGQETIGGLAVVGFFVVSGYLITKSGTRNDIVQFLWRRSLRIFPAFWMALAVGALVVGPAAWLRMGRSLADYASTAPGGPLSYVIANAQLTIRQWGIYDIFTDTTPYGAIAGTSVFNGSLWTLAYEWRAYLVIAALVLLGVLKRTPGVVIACLTVVYLMAAVLGVAPGAVGQLWPGFGDSFAVTLTLAFLIGASMAVLSHRIPLDGIAASVAGVVAFVTLAFGGWVLAGYVAYAYVLIYLAARLPVALRKVGAKHDYSYGMYVYGFLVQQYTAFLGWHLWGYAAWVAATLAVTAALAFVSWHVIESPALRLKDWGPGRGVAYWVSWLRARFARRAPVS